MGKGVIGEWSGVKVDSRGEQGRGSAQPCAAEARDEDYFDRYAVSTTSLHSHFSCISARSFSVAPALGLGISLYSDTIEPCAQAPSTPFSQPHHIVRPYQVTVASHELINDKLQVHPLMASSQAPLFSLLCCNNSYRGSLCPFRLRSSASGNSTSAAPLPEYPTARTPNTHPSS